MRFWKLASASLALALTTSANGAIISYAGYTHDTDTNIVTGNGLEWLQWDVTIRESINSIQDQLGTLDGGRWRVASNAEMAQLFNAFDFGLTFDSDEKTGQYAYIPYTDDNDQVMNASLSFIAMFGDTYAAGGGSYCYETHCFSSSNAIFGLDTDGNTFYNEASVYDDYQHQRDGGPIDGRAMINLDGTSPNFGSGDRSIALVRDVSPVPVPAAVWLFGSGLVGLIGFARCKKT